VQTGPAASGFAIWRHQSRRLRWLGRFGGRKFRGVNVFGGWRQKRGVMSLMAGGGDGRLASDVQLPEGPEAGGVGGAGWRRGRSWLAAIGDVQMAAAARSWRDRGTSPKGGAMLAENGGWPGPGRLQLATAGSWRNWGSAIELGNFTELADWGELHRIGGLGGTSPNWRITGIPEWHVAPVLVIFAAWAARFLPCRLDLRHRVGRRHDDACAATESRSGEPNGTEKLSGSGRGGLWGGGSGVGTQSGREGGSYF